MTAKSKAYLLQSGYILVSQFHSDEKAQERARQHREQGYLASVLREDTAFGLDKYSVYIKKEV
jgi:hypothetical protein